MIGYNFDTYYGTSMEDEMTLDEIKCVKGKVCQVKHGKRTAYYAPTGINPDGRILGYAVCKDGAIRRSKYGLVTEHVFHVSDVLKVMPVFASKW